MGKNQFNFIFHLNIEFCHLFCSLKIIYSCFKIFLDKKNYGSGSTKIVKTMFLIFYKMKFLQYKKNKLKGKKQLLVYIKFIYNKLLKFK